MHPVLEGIIRLIAEIAAEDYLSEISRNNPEIPPSVDDATDIGGAISHSQKPELLPTETL